MSRVDAYCQNSTTGRVVLTREVVLEVQLVLLRSRQESAVEGDRQTEVQQSVPVEEKEHLKPSSPLLLLLLLHLLSPSHNLC